MVTSFSSKSELALNLVDRRSSTSLSWATTRRSAPPTCRTRTRRGHRPDEPPIPGSYYRVVAPNSARTATFQFTETNAFSGDNGRAAILNDEPGPASSTRPATPETAHNPEPSGVVTGARRAAHPALRPARVGADSGPADSGRQLQHHPTRRCRRQVGQGRQLPRHDRLQQRPLLHQGQREQRRRHRLLRRHHRQGVPDAAWDCPSPARRCRPPRRSPTAQQSVGPSREDADPGPRAREHVRPARDSRPALANVGHRRERLPVRHLVRQPDDLVRRRRRER